MAYYSDDKEEDKDSQTGGGTQTGPAESATISGGGSGASNAPTAAPSQQAAKTPDNPGNFVGLKDYLNANKNQSQKLGDKVTSGINNDISSANTAVAGLRDQFKSKVQAGQLQGIDTAADEGKGLINKAATTGQVSDADKARYGQIASAAYSGPNALTDATDIYQPAANQVTKAQQEADNTQTEAGKQTVLRNMNQSPTYTTGAQRFDSYLLNDPATQQKLADARTSAGGLQGQLDTQTANAADEATQAKTQAQSVQDAVKSAFGQFGSGSTAGSGALGDYQNTVNNQLQQAQQNEAGLASRVNGGQLTTQDLQSLGVANDPTYGVDFKNYFQDTAPTLAGVTTGDEKARYDALRSLGGITSDDLYGGSSPGDIGGFKPAANVDAYNQAVAAKKQAYEVTDPKTKADDLISALKGRSAGYGPGQYQDFEGAVNSATDATGIKSALDALEAREKQEGINSDYLKQQTALRDYLNNVLPGIRSQTLVKG